MKKLQCEACGGIEIKKIGDDLFECQNCGVQYSSAEVKKLLVEISGTVAIDKSSEVDNLIHRANEYYYQGEKEKALEYCNRVLDVDVNNEKAKNLLNLIKENVFILVKAGEWYSGSAGIHYDGELIKKIKCGEELKIKASFGYHTLAIKYYWHNMTYKINIQQCENTVFIHRNAAIGNLYFDEV